jgi:peptidoglycan/xylan/chitin deacetylase (PgdA/CDA1 family)
VLAPDLLTGASTMAAGSICLTYDDGPGATDGDGRGPRTLPLAQFLADEEIRATFFMCGVHVAQMPDAPAQVRRMGHVVGNHTWHHWHLPEVLAAGGDVVGELAVTDDLLDLPPGEPVYLRPPYGHWSPQVAEALNAAPQVSTGVIGPVGWDIDSGDWVLWERRASPQEAATLVLDAVEAVGSGIVLMHDSTADLPDVRAGNAAYETTMLLVPELRRRGYAFVALDEVPLH